MSDDQAAESPGSAPETEIVRVRVRVRKKRKRAWYKRRKAKIAFLVVGLVVLLAFMDALWAAVTIDRDLRTARDDLLAGAAAMQAGNLQEAQIRFTLAGVAADHASGALGHPTVRLAKSLPWVGANARAVETLGDAVSLTAQAGNSLVDAATAVGWSGDQLSWLGQNGRVDTAAIASAAPHIQAAASLLGKARGTLGGVQTSGLLGPITSAATAARAQLDRFDGLARQAATLTKLLPGFLGNDGPKTYMVLMMTLADPRGSGGYPGSFGILRADHGQLQMEEMQQMNTLPAPVPPVVSQKEDQRRYVRYGALTHFIATSYSPDFPRTARLLMAMWEQNGGQHLDGVIGVDSVWVSYLLSSIGEVTVPGIAEPLTSANVSDVINRQSYLTMSQTASDAQQNAIGAALFQALLSRSPQPGPFASGMATAAAERHLQVYSTDPAAEDLIASLGAAGTFHLGPVPLSVAWDGTVASRSGYFTHKSETFTATVNQDGSVDVVGDVTVKNEAPTSPPSILLGDGTDGPVGYNSVNTNIYLPPAATHVTTEVLGGPGLQLIEPEFDTRVVLQFLATDPGQSATARVTYTLPATDSRQFRVDITPLPALNPDQMTVTIKLPQGTSPTAVSPGTSVSGSTVTWSGSPTVPTNVWVRR